MKRLIALLPCLLLMQTTYGQQVVGADTKGEGMWLPNKIKSMHEEKMKEKGMTMDAEDIYDVNNSSIKDAIIRLNGGSCTAEFVSEDGLLFTNHHCAYDLISKHSSEENNYLENGFWAESHEEELKNPGYTASRLVRMKDVTDAVVPAIDTASKRQAQQLKRKIFDSLTSEATADTHFTAEVKSMYHGNEYYLMVYETFKDVRLVGAPSSDIGKFGGDTDNWMWPRHTGDFSVLRVYTGPDGKPAEYSEDNVPYEPKHHLPISLKGYDQGAFSMIMGYPGTTERYLTSHDIRHKMKVEQPTIINAFDKILTNMKNKMDESEEADIKLASEYASLSNYHKYLKGQLKGLKHYDLVGKKASKEKDFLKWVNENEERKAQYGSIFKNVKSSYKQLDSISPGFYYFAYGLFQLDIAGYAYQFNNFRKNLSRLASGDASEEKVDSVANAHKEDVQEFFEDNYLEMEKETLRELLVAYCENVPAEQRPAMLNQLIKNNPGRSVKKTVNNYIDQMYNIPAERRQDLLGYAYRLRKLANRLDQTNGGNSRVDSLAETLGQDIKGYLTQMGAEKAKMGWNKDFTQYAVNTESEQRPDFLNEQLADNPDKATETVIKDYMADVYEKGFLFGNQTALLDTNDVAALLDNPEAKKIRKDPMVKLAENLAPYKSHFSKPSLILDSAKVMDYLSNQPSAWELDNEKFLDFATRLIMHYRMNYIRPYRSSQGAIENELKKYIAGLREWKPEKRFYPNANSTMRLSYGVVEPYYPKDAVFYDYYTTHRGILEKEDPEDEEFDVPKKLKSSIVKKDFGRYAEGANLQLCFLTDNDITGGNSGSPVINGEGHLMGIAFDGNWESMTGDLVVDETVNRTISVDSRYVLFVIDKIANSDHIMEELDVIEE